MPLLEGTDGQAKMSKSYGNYIGINESAEEIFGKVMSISDELMLRYYVLLTDVQLSAVRKKHPKEAKEELAWMIVKDYHGPTQAQAARDNFNKVFKEKELPADMRTYAIAGEQNILDLLTASGLAKSRNEARRLIQQGGVIFGGEKISAEDFLVTGGGVLKVGARRFLKIIKK
jgi:tyrosyl-tRNA synthetase